jgi:hypothetical protein
MATRKKQAPRVEFSQEIFDRICALIADGSSLRAACEKEGMPHRTSFNVWRKSEPELQAQYDAACLDREEIYFEQIIDIADECRVGVKKTTKANGDIETVEIDMVERAKVQIDARKWSLARMNRKKYGDHITEELTGPNGGPLQVVRLRMAPVDELPE